MTEKRRCRCSASRRRRPDMHQATQARPRAARQRLVSVRRREQGPLVRWDWDSGVMAAEAVVEEEIRGVGAWREGGIEYLEILYRW